MLTKFYKLFFVLLFLSGGLLIAACSAVNSTIKTVEAQTNDNGAQKAAATPVPAATAATATTTAKGEQTAVLAGGCFWGLEAVFEHLKGVSDVTSGYSGGSKETADYETVSDGDTDHAESVKITFDPAQISYRQLLQIYFAVAHDPTELNRQGPDSGTQYRSSIFYADDRQKQDAESYIAELTAAHKFPRPIVTKIVPLEAFYPAEDYHQNYLAQHPNQPYIVVNDQPKVENLRKQFPELYK